MRGRCCKLCATDLHGVFACLVLRSVLSVCLTWDVFCDAMWCTLEKCKKHSCKTNDLKVAHVACWEGVTLRFWIIKKWSNVSFCLVLSIFANTSDPQYSCCFGVSYITNFPFNQQPTTVFDKHVNHHVVLFVTEIHADFSAAARYIELCVVTRKGSMLHMIGAPTLHDPPVCLKLGLRHFRSY